MSSRIPEMQNGKNETNRTNAQNRTEADIYGSVVESSASGIDDFLESVNLGVGNYTGAEYWQQMESYGHYLYGAAAFQRKLLERAIHQTVVQVAREEDTLRWVTDNGDSRSKHIPDREKNAVSDRYESREEYLQQIKSIWDDLPAHKQKELLEDKAGVSDSWIPTHARMMTARHEASRGKGARILDNVFGRIKKFVGKDQQNSLKEGL